jgi:hypothetical protein
MESISPAPNSPVSAGKEKPSIWFYTSIVLTIALVVLAVVTTIKLSGSQKDVLSAEQAADQLLDFINEVYGAQVGQATLKSVNEQNGLYQVTVTVTANGQPLDQSVFVTRDGKLFIPQTVDIEQLRGQFQALQQESQNPPAPAPTPISPE